MKLVAGLGNPGARYRGTRHNVGFAVVDLLAQRHGLAVEPAPAGVDALVARWRRAAGHVWLAEPQTFMNLSGEAVGALVRYLRIPLPDLLVVCDDVNLPLGRLRGRASGSEGGHNGLRSVAQHLATTDYPRLRVGVGRPNPSKEMVNHVLARFAPDERAAIDEAVGRAADAVECWVTDGLERMMNVYNREGT